LAKCLSYGRFGGIPRVAQPIFNRDVTAFSKVAWWGSLSVTIYGNINGRRTCTFCQGRFENYLDTATLLKLKKLECSVLYIVNFCRRPASWSSGQSFWLLIMRSRTRFPVLPWGFFLEGEDPHGDHGLSSLVEFRFKAPPGTSYSYITIHLIGTT
jgi:hypothetical protein